MIVKEELIHADNAADAAIIEQTADSGFTVRDLVRDAGEASDCAGGLDHLLHALFLERGEGADVLLPQTCAEKRDMVRMLMRERAAAE